MTDHTSGKPERERKSRRVTFNPAGDRIDPHFVDPGFDKPDDERAESQHSNDEQLKRDKPPHWG